MNIEIFLPGKRPIPEFKAVEHFILKNANAKDASEIFKEMHAMLKAE